MGWTSGYWTWYSLPVVYIRLKVQQTASLSLSTILPCSDNASQPLSFAMPASLLCSLCSDPCSSVEDLRNHLRSSHAVNKKDLSEHIMKVMEEQIKKQESRAEVVTLDEDEEKGEDEDVEKEIMPENVDNFKQPSKAAEATDDDVKEFFKLKGESLIETMLKAEHANVEVGLSFEEVVTMLSRMKKEVKNTII